MKHDVIAALQIEVGPKDISSLKNVPSSCKLTNSRLPPGPYTIEPIGTQRPGEACIFLSIEIFGKQVTFKLFQIMHLERCPIVHPRKDVFLMVPFCKL